MPPERERRRIAQYFHSFRNLPEKSRRFRAKSKLYPARRSEQVCRNWKFCVFNPREKERPTLQLNDAPLNFRKFKARIHGRVNDVQLAFFFQKIKKTAKIGQRL
jgi:hypothetical protein